MLFTNSVVWFKDHFDITRLGFNITDHFFFFTQIDVGNEAYGETEIIVNGPSQEKLDSAKTQILEALGYR